MRVEVGLRGSPTRALSPPNPKAGPEATWVDLGIPQVVHHVGHIPLGEPHVAHSPSSPGTQTGWVDKGELPIL